LLTCFSNTDTRRQDILHASSISNWRKQSIS